MDEFDDVEELAKSQNGSLLIQLIKVSSQHLFVTTKSIEMGISMHIFNVHLMCLCIRDIKILNEASYIDYDCKSFICYT